LTADAEVDLVAWLPIMQNTGILLLRLLVPLLHVLRLLLSLHRHDGAVCCRAYLHVLPQLRVVSNMADAGPDQGFLRDRRRSKKQARCS
jgi:hypothetical protein